MPIYTYHCSGCGKVYDAMKSFSDSDKPDICPDCGKEAKRTIAEPAAVIYKGSGFYCKDNPSASSCAGCHKGE